MIEVIVFARFRGGVLRPPRFAGGAFTVRLFNYLTISNLDKSGANL